MSSGSQPNAPRRKNGERKHQTYLQAVPSLRYSSSSEPWRLGLREVARDCAGEFRAEFVLEFAPEAMRERAFRDTVLPLSRACRRRSCMLCVYIGAILRLTRIQPQKCVLVVADKCAGGVCECRGCVRGPGGGAQKSNYCRPGGKESR